MPLGYPQHVGGRQKPHRAPLSAGQRRENLARLVRFKLPAALEVGDVHGDKLAGQVVHLGHKAGIHAYSLSVVPILERRVRLQDAISRQWP